LEDRVSLIQGPPGTGKTEVACHLIREIVKSKQYDGILVVAETNVAVDNLTRRLRNDVVVVRVGPIEGLESDLYDVSLEGQVKVIAEKEARKSKVRDKQGDIHSNTRLINRVLSAADVILTTCAGAGDSRLENYKFPFVLVDEATQTLETTLLCSLVHGVKHLVMIGDPKQLGPISKEFPEGIDDPNLPKMDCLSETLFHRWYNEGFIKVSFLDVQYRMHPTIMQFPSSEFYDNKLKASRTTQNRLPIIFPWPDGDRPLCFIDIDGVERKRGTSYYNKSEVDAVCTAIDVLLSVDEESYRSHRIGIHQIGVITMYQGQVQKLKEVIQCAVKVSTVDGFQGQERDVIIVSTVRSNSRGSLGFSDDERRLNVLLTRAKRGLVVIGNKSTLQNSRTWNMWLKSAPQLKLENVKPVSGLAPRHDDRQKGKVNKPQTAENRDSSKRGYTKRNQTIYKRR
jgi:superfamily I DNA and/or RNA helicase